MINFQLKTDKLNKYLFKHKIDEEFVKINY